MNREPKLSQGLDYYKATMGQLEYGKHPDAEVTFTLKNRAYPTIRICKRRRITQPAQ